MKTISKAFVGTVAAGAMAMTSAAPAFARDHYRDNDKVDAGDIIAGAVILGGIAAIASAIGKDRKDGRYYDTRYRDRRYDERRLKPRRAVRKCVRAAERRANRQGFRYADVTQIRDVDHTPYGWRVKGRIVVEDGRYNYRNTRYGERRYDNRSRDYDRGRFTCYIERGRVADVDYRGIRGLR